MSPEFLSTAKAVILEKEASLIFTDGVAEGISLPMIEMIFPLLSILKI
jgi:hypothetical protein